MGNTRNSEEIKLEMITKMGPEFGALWYSLYNEITWLTWKWIEFKELYESKNSRFEIMNRTAPFFFYTIQRVLWENLVLGISRITDRPETREKRNITIEAVRFHIEDPSFKSEIENDLKAIKNASKFCRAWRNRWIAHMDYELAINSSPAAPLEKATSQQLKAVMEMIHALYNKISKKYIDPASTMWFGFGGNRGAVDLLRNMENGLRFTELMVKKHEMNDWSPDDFVSKV